MDNIRIKGFRDIEDAFRKPDLRQSLYNAGGDLFEGVLVTLHGDEHRTRRSIEGRLLKRNFFRQYEAEVFPPLLQESMDRYLNSDAADFKELGYRIMLNVSLAFAGIDRQDNSAEEADMMHKLLSQFGMAATLGQYKGEDKDAVRQEIRDALAKFEVSFFAPSRAYREDLVKKFNAGELSESELPRDILTMLILYGDKLNMSNELMMREVGFFYLASAHTSVHTITHAIHEVFNWFESRDEEPRSLANDPFTLQKFVLESLRLHPASPEAWRESDGAVTVGTDVEIPAGANVILDLQAANRDPEIFGDDADKFDPFRERTPKINPAGLSFGGGIHVCMGMLLVTGTLLKSDEDYDADNHQYGTITQILQEILRRGARLDPDSPPKKLLTSERDTWEVYPLLFDGAVK